MKKFSFLLAPDAAPGKAAATAAPAPVDIAGDVKKIQAILAGWQTAKATGQLQIAIGGLGTAVDYALHHINLTTPAAAPQPAGNSAA